MAMTWRDRLKLSEKNALGWWLLGALVLAVTLLLPIRGNFLSALVMLLFVGLTGVLLYVVVDSYRKEHKLTWKQLWLIAAGIYGIYALAQNWQAVRPVVLIIGYYGLLIGVGLGVLYLAVRIVRVAWMGPVTALADALNSQLAQRDTKIDALRQQVVQLTDGLAGELSDRYEEINLIYTISEILGHTTRLDEAAQRILREVSTVVKARRATLLMHDPEQQVLRLAAAQGMNPEDVDPIEVDDPYSVAARVFREMRIVSYNPLDPKAENAGCSEGRNYRGKAFLSVPVLYAAPGARVKPIGVINLTDRLGGDSFTPDDRKLVAAIANQIGAAVESARLVAQDLSQRRVSHDDNFRHQSTVTDKPEDPPASDAVC